MGDVKYMICAGVADCTEDSKNCSPAYKIHERGVNCGCYVNCDREGNRGTAAYKVPCREATDVEVAAARLRGEI